MGWILGQVVCKTFIHLIADAGLVMLPEKAKIASKYRIELSKCGINPRQKGSTDFVRFVRLMF